jgi:hypothetical protein
MSMTRKFKKQSLKRKTRGSKCRNSHRTKYARKSRRTRNRSRRTRNRLRKTRNRFSGGALSCYNTCQNACGRINDGMTAATSAVTNLTNKIKGVRQDTESLAKKKAQQAQSSAENIAKVGGFKNKHCRVCRHKL